LLPAIRFVELPEHPARAGRLLIVPGCVDRDEAVGLAISERPDQPVGDTEDGRVRADGECERGNGNGGKRGRSPHPTERVPQVLTDRVERHKLIPDKTSVLQTSRLFAALTDREGR
jgi:hypothetical protein